MATTIQVNESTVERLKYFKNYTKESYDEIINKLMDEREEGALSDETLRDIAAGLKGVREGKGTPLEDVAKEFGVKL
ncbi:hypothetical protein J4419_00395 [Candidatus Woesearchaeota archaeon]|nr:hypothetical protein [Candidatus Woesearchaeota archaeon]